MTTTAPSTKPQHRDFPSQPTNDSTSLRDADYISKPYVVDPDDRGIGTVRYPRLVPRDEECAKELKKRTLTNLYNERPTWLDLAHRRLDQAVAAAYAWPNDLTDEQILEKLLELNLACGRADAESALFHAHQTASTGVF